MLKTMLLTFGVLLVGLPASATWWTVNFDESPASGSKTCTVTSASGLSVLLAESSETGRRQFVAVFNLDYRTRAYLAWGEERFATTPADARDMGIFAPVEAPRLIHLLATSPPAYDWTTDDDSRMRGKALGVAKFAERYGECLDAMGWGADDDLRVERPAEPEPESTDEVEPTEDAPPPS